MSQTTHSQSPPASQHNGSPDPELDQPAAGDEPESPAEADRSRQATEDGPTLPLWQDVS